MELGGPSTTQFIFDAKPTTTGQKRLGPGAEKAIEGVRKGE
jgi:hypothetical protein